MKNRLPKRNQGNWMEPFLNLEKKVTFVDALVMTDKELASVLLVKRPVNGNRADLIRWRYNQRTVSHEVAWRRRYWKEVLEHPDRIRQNTRDTKKRWGND